MGLLAGGKKKHTCPSETAVPTFVGLSSNSVNGMLVRLAKGGNASIEIPHTELIFPDKSRAALVSQPFDDINAFVTDP